MNANQKQETRIKFEGWLSLPKPIPQKP